VAPELVTTPPPPDAGPSRTIRSADGTPIAVFTSGAGPPLVLVHGAAADHTTFRVLGPLLASSFTIHGIDRRGRGASGDTPPYAIEREFEDVAAVATALAHDSGGPVDVFGHSYGGRCALGAALLTPDVGRVISYEGAPTPPGERYGDAALATELAALAEAERNEKLLETFLTRVVGMTADELDRYRADPVWPRRVAAAPTIARELAVESGDEAGLERLGGVSRPVLQLLGGDSRREFRVATAALDDRLADGSIVVIPGAKHAAHHTHPDAVVEAVMAFLASADSWHARTR
jgi:pimeloyl-ACP methyl ester carboxylesterase